MEAVGNGYQETYKEFLERWSEIDILNAINETLEWDELTYMPQDAALFRGKQKALLTKLEHQRITDDRLHHLLLTLREGVEAGRVVGIAVANVREALRRVEQERKIPVELAMAIADHQSAAYDAWVRARKQSQFSLFAPYLEKMIVLQREKAEKLGYERNPYEALFALYEPDLSLVAVDSLFAELRKGLVPLIQKVLDSPNQPDSAILYQPYDIRKQEELSRDALQLMGFDFNAGRIDSTVHPFCAGLSPRDVRLATRYREEYFGDAIFSAIHEGGHGLYEQGMSPDYFGMPIGAVNSLGLHESQSRLWEVWVGRSSAFWEFLWPKMQKFFPDAVSGKTSRDLFRAVNEVKRSFIRVDSDPVTYNLHILLRYEVEREIMRGTVAVSEVPELWNAKMEEYLGIRPQKDKDGVLQDVHWSSGLFGYFPTYSLGNLISASIWNAAKRAMPIEENIRKGDLRSLREWLRQNVHQHGSLYTPQEILAKLGESLSVETFLGALKAHMSEVYERDF